MLNLQLALYTLFQHLNKRLLRNSLRKILTCVSSNQPPLYIIYWSYLSRRKIVHYASTSTSAVLTVSQKKNRYLLLLISNLLDLPCKAHVYSKIDLYYAYHLAHIADGDEWKTAFRTCYRSFKWSIMLFNLTNISVAFQ